MTQDERDQVVLLQQIGAALEVIETALTEMGEAIQRAIGHQRLVETALTQAEQALATYLQPCAPMPHDLLLDADHCEVCAPEVWKMDHRRCEKHWYQ